MFVQNGKILEWKREGYVGIFIIFCAVNVPCWIKVIIYLNKKTLPQAFDTEWVKLTKLTNKNSNYTINISTANDRFHFFLRSMQQTSKTDSVSQRFALKHLLKTSNKCMKFKPLNGSIWMHVLETERQGLLQCNGDD